MLGTRRKSGDCALYQLREGGSDGCWKENLGREVGDKNIVGMIEIDKVC